MAQELSTQAPPTPSPVPSQAPPLGAGGGPLLPGAVEQQQPQFISRFLEGQSGVTIKHVACGDLFTACLTGEPVRGLACGDSAIRRPPQSNFLPCLSFANCSLNNAFIFQGVLYLPDLLYLHSRPDKAVISSPFDRSRN